MEIKTNIKGLKEIKEFFDERRIKYTLRTHESLEDLNFIIGITGSIIGLVNILIELKKWLSKKEKPNQVIIIINNSKININSDSEDEIRRKLE